MVRQHTDWITDYLAAVVPRSEAPERFHYWVAASTLAGSLRRRVYIDMEVFQWYPNLFVVLVGPPGIVKKSTTINIGSRLLREVPNVHIGSDITTWEGFIDQVEQAVDIYASGPRNSNHRFSIDDTHKEGRALTCILSEWGTFIDPDNRMMINMLTELYDGKTDIPLSKNTKTQGTNTISNPFLNMIAGTTPDWISDNLKSRFGGWGFSSRCVFLNCMAPERIIPYPDEEWHGTFKTTMQSFQSDLLRISELEGEAALTPSARTFGREWYTQHTTRKAQLDAHPNHDPWLSYYLARKFDHIHKLALLSSVSHRSDLVIDLADLQAAAARCDEVELELAHVFGTSSGSASRSTRLNNDVWRSLVNMINKNKGGIPAREALRWCRRWMSYGEAQDLLKGLVATRELLPILHEGEQWITLNAPSEPTT